ncbi:Crp/Fnr family transcriptional regulator [Sphingomonas sp. ZB1N12]|uniref:Crp/Fnr family transcriptional regulator n=1 Tax=Sphingomonas arabinosi TaxID=3096160 RepID=UPI002FC76BDA
MLNLPCRVANFEPGTYLVRQGDIATSTCLVLSGFVCRTKISGNGSRQILSIHLKGDLIDLHNSFLAEADCNVQALTHVTVALIPSRAIIDLVEIRPKIRHALWLDILTDASISREWLLNIGQRNALERVAHLICEMALRQDAAGISKSTIYEWPMTQEQLGDATGLTAVHINRMLKTLRNDDIVSVNKRTFIIKDWYKLRSVADFTQGYLYQLNLSPSA